MRRKRTAATILAVVPVLTHEAKGAGTAADLTAAIDGAVTDEAGIRAFTVKGGARHVLPSLNLLQL